MLKTTILATLFAAGTAGPGAITYAKYSEAIEHVVTQFKAEKARALRVCYNTSTPNDATAVLMHARTADGKPLAYEMLRTEGGYRVATVAKPDNWPRKVTCQPVE